MAIMSALSTELIMSEIPFTHAWNATYLCGDCFPQKSELETQECAVSKYCPRILFAPIKVVQIKYT